MNCKKKISFILLSFYTVTSVAQVDPFAGTWQMQYNTGTNNQVIDLEFTISTPSDKNQLYPAQMKLQCDSFLSVYNLLLVKRNIRQLGIGRNKIPVFESPFSLGNWTVFLNGTLDLSRDNKGHTVLTVSRIVTNKYGVEMQDIKSFTGKNNLPAFKYFSFPR